MKLNKVLLIIGTSVFGIGAIMFFVLYSFIHVNLNELNGNGDVVKIAHSPNGNYQAELYYVDHGGARVSITYVSGEGE